METFSFELYAAGEYWDLDAQLTVAILEAGHDGSPGTRDGKLEIAFDREAGTLEDAVLSAIREVETAAGIRIESVQIDSDAATEKTINSLLSLRSSTTREHALEMWSKVG